MYIEDVFSLGSTIQCSFVTKIHKKTLEPDDSVRVEMAICQSLETAPSPVLTLRSQSLRADGPHRR